MKFEEFCSKDFRDITILILKWAKIGTSTLKENYRVTCVKENRSHEKLIRKTLTSL